MEFSLSRIATPRDASLEKPARWSFGLHFVGHGRGSLISAIEGGSPADCNNVVCGLQPVELCFQSGSVINVTTMRPMALRAILRKHTDVVLRCAAEVQKPPKPSLEVPLHLPRHELSSSGVQQVLGEVTAPSPEVSTSVIVLPSLLSEEDVAELHSKASKLSTIQSAGEHHEKVYLHANGYAREALPVLLDKVLTHMRGKWQGPLPTSPLGVRCIEYHTYRGGGALLDAGHFDTGSTLTISVSLTERNKFEGGEFLTWESGSAQVHSVGCGDAVLFDSHRVHNISTVFSGVRHSLVIELWTGPDNEVDRVS